MSHILDYTKANYDAMLLLLQKMVEFESPSANKEACDRLVNFMREQFLSIGAKAEIIENPEGGNHLHAEWGEGKEEVLCIGHLDTVWDIGEIKKRPFTVKENKAHGPGVLDMKAGDMYMFYALKCLIDLDIKPPHKIHIFLNTDEEIGSEHSRQFFMPIAERCKYALVAEPAGFPGGELKIGRKGNGAYTMKITGIPQHAGAWHEKGVSAIEEFARQTVKIHAQTDYESGTTYSVGLVQGGTAYNVIAPYCNAEVDFRVKTMAELAKVETFMKNLKPELNGTTLEISGGIYRPPFEFTEDNQALFNKVVEVAKEIGIEDLQGVFSGGASDGNITSGSVGCPTIDGFGGIGESPHAIPEWIYTEPIPTQVALIATVLSRI